MLEIYRAVAMLTQRRMQKMPVGRQVIFPCRESSIRHAVSRLSQRLMMGMMLCAAPWASPVLVVIHAYAWSAHDYVPR